MVKGERHHEKEFIKETKMRRERRKWTEEDIEGNT